MEIWKWKILHLTWLGWLLRFWFLFQFASQGKIHSFHSLKVTRGLTCGFTLATGARRNLLDAGKSIIFGNGTDSIVVGRTVQFHVQARNSSGKNITTGGDKIRIRIMNECTKSDIFSGDAVSGQRSIINQEVKEIMTDNGDGTYTYSYTTDAKIDGTVTVEIMSLENGLYSAWSDGWDSFGVEPIDYYNFTDINSNWRTFVDPKYHTDMSATYYSYLEAPIVDDDGVNVEKQINFTGYGDDGFWLIINNQELIHSGSAKKVSFDMVEGEMYELTVKQMFNHHSGSIYLRWEYSGQSSIAVPTSNYYRPSQIGNKVYNIDVEGQTGYTGYPFYSKCTLTCGDGVQQSWEVCDDGNTNDTDGCSADGTQINSTWAGYGGNTNTQSTCEECINGLYVSSSGNTVPCVTVCGDGLQAKEEECDDNNTDDNDGCSDSGTIEDNWACYGGDRLTESTGEECVNGLYMSSDGNTVPGVTECGDGLQAKEEECDDHNTDDNDGCSSQCKIEDTWAGFGGDRFTNSTCQQGVDGFHIGPNGNQEPCITIGGDGVVAGTEECDDKNTEDNDGCSSECTIESGWAGFGGDRFTLSTCQECTDGLYFSDDGKNGPCKAIGGDSRQAGDEEGDDSNTNSNDGCSSSCIIENNWACYGGDQFNKSTGEEGTDGFYLSPSGNTVPGVTECGDGFQAKEEECDDHNTDDNDGCSSECKIENNWACYDGDRFAQSSCEEGIDGLYISSEGNTVPGVSVCGDGLQAKEEECDDSNTDDNDGCSSQCKIEGDWAGFQEGGSTQSTCQQGVDGFYISSDGNEEPCITIGGDGVVAGSEECDDLNTDSYDGCSPQCQIETGWAGYGGNRFNQSTCEQCRDGLYISDEGNTEPGVTKCGDGLQAKEEECDDHNTDDNDGCSSQCKIESNWAGFGGDRFTNSTCQQGVDGLYVSNDGNTVPGVTVGGDGLQAEEEECDDNNTLSSDGCSSECKIEDNWACYGGDRFTLGTGEECVNGLYLSSNGNIFPGVTECGDGLQAKEEECDDHNTLSNDGCSSECKIENNWAGFGGDRLTQSSGEECINGLYINDNGNIEPCKAIGGDGLVARDEAGDDSNTEDNDGCSSECTVESDWACYGGDRLAQSTCQQGIDGFYISPDGNKEPCVTVGGDGLVAGEEACDDGNEDDNDGGSADGLTIENDWSGYGGNRFTQSTCQECVNGFYISLEGNIVPGITKCGDGLVAGGEVGDDGNTDDKDGGSSDCMTIEEDWVCFGGDRFTQSTCKLCSNGYYISNDGNQIPGVGEGGDGLITGDEKCDDGNTQDLDGCSSDCLTIESGWICNRFMDFLASICVKCTSGYYVNSPAYPIFCITEGGDGFRAGGEFGDDNNTISGDGCALNGTVEDNSWCDGGNVTNKDECKVGQTGYIVSDKSCITKCGDGVQVGEEECDDNNDVDGDGCSSNGAIENGFSCTTPDEGQMSSCIKCEYGYEPNEDNNDCIEIKVSENLQVVGQSTSAVVATSIFIVLMPSGTDEMSFQGPFIIINFIQILILIPLIGASVSSKVIEFLASMNIWLFQFEFISFQSIFAIDETFKEKQSNAYLYTMNLSYQSTLVNVSNALSISIIIFVIYLVALLVSRLVEVKYQRINWVNSITRWHGKIQIMIFYEILTLLLISGLSELNTNKIETATNKASFFITIGFLITVAVLTILVICCWCKARSKKDQKYLLLSGLRDNIFSYSFGFVFLIRRIVFCLVIITFDFLTNLAKLSMFLIVEVLYMCYFVFLSRPYKNNLYNIIETLHEFIYVVLVSFLFHYNSRSKWTTVVGDTFVFTIAITIMISALICAGYLAHYIFRSQSAQVANRQETLNETG